MQIFKRNAQDIAKAFTKYSLWQGGGGGGGSAVTWVQLATEGEHIANITIDGNETEVYAPSGGSSSTPKIGAPTILYNNTSFSNSVVLNDDFTNYDFITIIWNTTGDYTGGLSYLRDGGVTHPSSYLEWLKNNNLAIQYTGYYRRYSGYYITNNNTFTFARRGADGEDANRYSPFIFQVLGYKFE